MNLINSKHIELLAVVVQGHPKSLAAHCVDLTPEDARAVLDLLAKRHNAGGYIRSFASAPEAAPGFYIVKQ